MATYGLVGDKHAAGMLAQKPGFAADCFRKARMCSDFVVHDALGMRFMALKNLGDLLFAIARTLWRFPGMRPCA